MRENSCVATACPCVLCKCDYRLSKAGARLQNAPIQCSLPLDIQPEQQIWVKGINDKLLGMVMQTTQVRINPPAALHAQHGATAFLISGPLENIMLARRMLIVSVCARPRWRRFSCAGNAAGYVLFQPAAGHRAARARDAQGELRCSRAVHPCASGQCRVALRESLARLLFIRSWPQSVEAKSSEYRVGMMYRMRAEVTGQKLVEFYDYYFISDEMDQFIQNAQQEVDYGVRNVYVG